METANDEDVDLEYERQMYDLMVLGIQDRENTVVSAMGEFVAPEAAAVLGFVLSLETVYRVLGLAGLVAIASDGRAVGPILE